ncbi:uncharacterized protein KGF55_002687 [Candida pseudojiufengensis]|uniref:uncharacterized protein n=1 Tax=Candida pseudojiufengensis TaxID=497109 RepID=UPI0022256B95|nr:uncharacterized protein KGF55_002687 [Candida pseudojiufengensis]KAI5963807.1 hypothetical protein KGF55_002687 [Candida pseudojiufengensis]
MSTYNEVQSTSLKKKKPRNRGKNRTRPEQGDGVYATPTQERKRKLNMDYSTQSNTNSAFSWNQGTSSWGGSNEDQNGGNPWSERNDWARNNGDQSGDQSWKQNLPRSEPSTSSYLPPNPIKAQQLQPMSYSDISRREIKDDFPPTQNPSSSTLGNSQSRPLQNKKRKVQYNTTASNLQSKKQNKSKSSTQANTKSNPKTVDCIEPILSNSNQSNTNVIGQDGSGNGPNNDLNQIWQEDLSPEVLKFVETKLAKMEEKINPRKHEIAKQQVVDLIRQAKDENLLWENDWSNQLVPLLDGGGPLILACKKPLKKKHINTLNSQEYGSNVSTTVPENVPENFHSNNESGSNEVEIIEVDNGPSDLGGHAITNTFQQSSDQKSSNLPKLPPIPSGIQPISGSGDIYIDTNAAQVPQMMPYSKIKSNNLTDDYISDERKRQRSVRFDNTATVTPTYPINTESINKSGAIVGLSTNLEKSYLRLTSEPDPRNVRSQETLKLSFDFVMKKANSMDPKDAYGYLINQFKSIRQDLTVQHLKNEFTIKVYETNAKISIQNGDLGEFNQCQTQLRHLYHMERSSKSLNEFIGSEVELLCYKVIYMMITRNNSEICKLRMTISKDYKGFLKKNSDLIYFKFITTLFKCNDYLLLNNCCMFFNNLKRFEKFNELEVALTMIKQFLFEKVRISGLYLICNSYRQVNVQFVQTFLNFQDEAECDTFLKKYKLAGFCVKEFLAAAAKVRVTELYKKISKIDIKGQL